MRWLVVAVRFFRQLDTKDSVLGWSRDPDPRLMDPDLGVADRGRRRGFLGPGEPCVGLDGRSCIAGPDPLGRHLGAYGNEPFEHLAGELIAAR
jgi:hypothetical protein